MSFLSVPLLVLLLSISHYFVVLFDSTFINPLYATCTPIFQGFIIHVLMNGHSLDNDSESESLLASEDLWLLKYEHAMQMH